MNHNHDHGTIIMKNEEAVSDVLANIVEEKTGLKLCKHCGTFKPVSEFSNRDLLLELQRRGFKGHLTYTEVHNINLTDFN